MGDVRHDGVYDEAGDGQEPERNRRYDAAENQTSGYNERAGFPENAKYGRNVTKGLETLPPGILEPLSDWIDGHGHDNNCTLRAYPSGFIRSKSKTKSAGKDSAERLSLV